MPLNRKSAHKEKPRMTAGIAGERQQEAVREAARVMSRSRRARLRGMTPDSRPSAERPLPMTSAEPEDDFSGI